MEDLKIYTKYDNECMIYLAIEILGTLFSKRYFMYIDLYYEKITEIYEDYKKEDNSNFSLHDSINMYINNHKKEILNKMEDIIFSEEVLESEDKENGK